MATYRVSYTDRTGTPRRPWTVTADGPVQAAQAGIIDERPARWGAAHMYGRNGVGHRRGGDSLNMVDGMEQCSVTLAR